MARLLSVVEVADRLGCSRWHVYDLIHDGDLTAQDVARGKRSVFKVAPDEVDRYIQSITFTPAGKPA